jgi:hypothetical protein
MWLFISASLGLKLVFVMDWTPPAMCCCYNTFILDAARGKRVEMKAIKA